MKRHAAGFSATKRRVACSAESPSEKSALELEKLKAEVSILKEKGGLEVQKLRSEIAHLQNKSAPELDKLQAEIRELKRPYWAKNVTPLATLVAATLGIFSTIKLNELAAERDSLRKAKETIAKKYIGELAEPVSEKRRAAATQSRHIDAEVADSALTEAFSDSRARGTWASSESKAREMYLRTGIMEVVGLGGGELSQPRRLALLRKGLDDTEPLVRHKAIVGLDRLSAEAEMKFSAEVEIRKFRRIRKMTYNATTYEGREMVEISAGEGVIGSDEDENDERPAQQVKFERFLIDTKAVTNKQWNDVMGSDTPTKFEESNRKELKPWRLSNPNLPVLGASVIQAREFCEKTGRRRLPTELEWEIAARGSDGWIFPWGVDRAVAEAVLKKRDEDEKNTPSDAMRSARLSSAAKEDISVFQILGMVTSVMEWTDSEYRIHPIPYSSKKCDENCVLKGSSGFEKGTANIKRASRRTWKPLKSNSDDLIGFRCAKGDST